MRLIDGLPRDPDLPRSMIPATGSCRKTPKIAGTWKQYSERKFSGFFRWMPDNFLYLSAGTDRKSPEKIRKISGRNIASTKSMELRGTGGFRAGLPDLGNANN
jgi:hypothetical protein